MITVGLDVGSYAIKAVVGKSSGKQFEVQKAVEIANPIGAISSENPEKRKQLVTALDAFFTEQVLPRTDIRVSLPEASVSTKIVTMPLLSDAELASAIQWQVEQHIPIPLEEMQYEYSVIRRSEPTESVKTMDVLIIGTKKAFVQDFANIFFEAGLDVTDMETDTLSQLRVLQYLVSVDESVAVLHIGAGSSTISLLVDGRLSFVHAVPVGGLLFTRAVERGIGLDTARAEEYKRTYGLQAQQLEGRVRAALTPIVDSLVIEVQKALRFFAGQYSGKSIARVYMTGGSLYLMDLLPYVSEGLSLEVIPVELLRVPGIVWPDAVKQDARFLIATGLMIKPER